MYLIHEIIIYTMGIQLFIISIKIYNTHIFSVDDIIPEYFLRDCRNNKKTNISLFILLYCIGAKIP